MIKDYAKVTTDLQRIDGGKITEKTDRNYRRVVALLPGEDGVPETQDFYWGNKTVTGVVDVVELGYWYRQRYSGTEYAWDLYTIRVTGRQAKKDGSPGERILERTYFDSDDKHDRGRYIPPQWLKDVIEATRPEGETNPYSLAISANEEEIEVELRHY